MYLGCLKSIHPFLISREPVTLPGCILATSQTRLTAHPGTVALPRCSHLAVRCCWPFIVCDHCIRKDWASRSASSWQCSCQFYGSRAGFSGKALHHPSLSTPLHHRFGSLQLLALCKVNSLLKGKRFVNATVTQYTSSASGVSLSTD